MPPLSTNVAVNKKNGNDSIFTYKKATWLWSPLLLLVLTVIIDQWSKYLVVLNIGVNTKYGEIIDLFNGFIWIVKVYNKGIAFSIASDTYWWIRLIVVYTIPLLLVLFLIKIIVYSKVEIPFRWYASFVAGGGIGNLIDRLFREEGVVDFISVNTYNIFGISRWATFNFADVSVVIGMILWVFSLFRRQIKEQKSNHKNDENANMSESNTTPQEYNK